MSKKTYLIIGGSSGISQSLVQELSPEATVIATSRKDTNISGAERTLRYEAKDQQPLDLSGLDHLDGLVYCPGSINLKPFKSLKVEDFLKDYEVNFLGAVQAIKSALPLLLKGSTVPSIVLFSTVATRIGMPYHASISSAKAAIEGLGISLAAELAPKVRVNIIAPSLTDTPLAESLLNNEVKIKAAQERHPLKQVGDPQDIAKLIKWILSDDAKFLTGQVIPYDGGMSSIAKV